MGLPLRSNTDPGLKSLQIILYPRENCKQQAAGEDANFKEAANENNLEEDEKMERIADAIFFVQCTRI